MDNKALDNFQIYCTMIHKRKLRIENIDSIRYAKTIIVDVGLDRKKEWELTIKDLGLKVNDNKINFAKKEIKQQLKQLHQDYIEDKLEEELKTAYLEYIKPYYLRSPNSQKENIKKMREEHNELKAKLKQENKNGDKI